jgi:type 1 glutamine amidotransferase
MNRTFAALILLLILTVISVSSYASSPEKDVKPIRILILSGYNNHEWKKTTPLLTRIFDEANLFITSVTDKPDTLTYATLKNFDLLLSNANTWPDNQKRMSSSWEADFYKYVTEGGGALFFHAGASSFYGWDEYFRIGIGRWGKETGHNAPVVAKLYGFDQKHPITKGLKGFQIMDEIWEKTELFEGAATIGSLKATNAKDGHPIDQPALFVNQTGKGRSFFTILGHDERALVNSGLRTLLVRAAQWCAGREVTFQPPAEINMQVKASKPRYSWHETDTTFALLNNKETVWQFNYNDRFQRPYFHPLTVDNTVITCLSPPDHPWHLGLWFCWKYINKLNYWEYLTENRSAKTGYKSEGSTEIAEITLRRNADFTSDIHLKINYHPLKGATVLTEERNYHTTLPGKDGSYMIEEDHLLTAIADSVVLDRTPPARIANGRISGGYAGMSVRFNQDFTSPEFQSSADSAQCAKCTWLYYGFRSMTDKKVGIMIEQDPQYTPE